MYNNNHQDNTILYCKTIVKTNEVTYVLHNLIHIPMIEIHSKNKHYVHNKGYCHNKSKK